MCDVVKNVLLALIVGWVLMIVFFVRGAWLNRDRDEQTPAEKAQQLLYEATLD